MNEITRIHIAGVPYEIDAGAKKQLDKYMEDIKKSLGDASDAIDDIEIRITEILAGSGVNKNDVIKLADVAAVKEQLGEPKDFSSDGEAVEGGSLADKVRSSFAEKKYFRDTENGMVGGVIAGLAAYTGWDVTLLRILFVVLAIFTTIFPFLILYIVVWISAPEARTATDRLAMKGEPINLETIKATAHDSAERVSKAAQVAGEKIHKTAPDTANVALRVILAIFGVIGLLIFIPCLIILIPGTIMAIFNIAAASIAVKPLFIATAILIGILAFTIVSIGLTVSGALLSGKFGKSTGISIIASFFFAIALTIAASITGGIWYTNVGHDEAGQAIRAVVRDINVDVDGDGERVQVDFGPVHINAGD